jgi:hypothetical protein
MLQHVLDVVILNLILEYSFSKQVVFLPRANEKIMNGRLLSNGVPTICATRFDVNKFIILVQILNVYVSYGSLNL